MEGFNLFDAMGVPEPEKKVEEVKSTAKKEIDTDRKPAPKPIPVKNLEGEIIVKVYGQELFRHMLEEPKEQKLVLEDIREKLVSDYGFAEFSKDRTTMTYSEESKIVVPAISFQKKG